MFKNKHKQEPDKIPIIIMPDDVVPCEIATVEFGGKTALLLRLPNKITFVIYIKRDVHTDITSEIKKIFEKEKKNE